MMVNNLRKIMDEKNISEGYVAKKLHYTPSAIHHYCTGRTVPNVIIALKIANILKVELKEIWEVVDEDERE